MQAALEKASYWSDRGWQVAGGVNPRSRRRSPCGKGADVSHYAACVLDFDSEVAAREGEGRLLAAGIEPSVIVHSGRGRHFYLLLDPPARVGEFREVAKRAGDCCGSDAVHDPARILRTPGTLNPRTGTRAAVLKLSPEVTYAPSELREAFPAPEVIPLPACAFTGTRRESIDLPVSTRYVSRSEATIAAARKLQRSGLDREQAEAMLMSSPLAERSAEDVKRCIAKVWSSACEVEVSRVAIRACVVKGSGTFLRIEVLNGRWIGRSWWQRIDEVQDDVHRCLRGPVNAQREGRVTLGMTPFRQGAALRVRRWLP